MLIQAVSMETQRKKSPHKMSVKDVSLQKGDEGRDLNCLVHGGTCSA